ncbi:MAG: hypothetical protein P4L22_06300 [Candidatus Babeliales bacterium]|nr:hypothetical protein [Candidatus Babeliales bacterium]
MLFKKSQEVLTILVEKEKLTFCSWNVSNDKLMFNAVYQYKLEHEILDLVIFNYNKIENVIEDFLEQHKIQNPAVYISFDSSLLDECIFNFVQDTEDNINYEQISLDLQNQTYYRVGIKQVLLFQYQLLFMKLKLNLVKISSDIIILFNINKQNYYKESLTVGEFKNNIVNSINFDFEKYITNNDAIVDLDKLTLINSLGLFINE